MKKQTIWIVDYGLGNLQSVYGAFSYFGVNVVVSDKPYTKADKIVLPGVGAFGEGMKNLKSRGLVQTIYEEVEIKKKYFLGICLGLQLLFETSEEAPGIEGLGFIKGKVKHLSSIDDSIRIPNIGWGETNLKSCDIFNGMREKEYFYYIHSYYVLPENSSFVKAEFSSKVSFPVAVKKDNIYGVQFHPEKSGQKGLKLVENFLNL